MPNRSMAKKGEGKAREERGWRRKDKQKEEKKGMRPL